MSITERADERTDSSGPVGAQLRRARTAQGLSIEDVCQRTNIRPTVVHALENGDLEPSGGAVYARGHVRTLAHALDLNTDSLLANFDASYGAQMPRMPVLIPEPEALVEPSPRAARDPDSRPVAARRGPRWSWVFGLVLVVVIVIALVQLLLPEGSSSGKPPRSLLPSAAAKPALKPAPKPKPTTPSLHFPVPAEGVTLRIVLKKPSWLEVSDGDGVPLIQTTVKPSAHSLDLHAQILRATIGDAGAVEVSCNGHPLGPIGVSKQAVTLIFARGNLFCPAA
jgi:cytoskeleton protein RodZ